ncbi:hypothetical protein C8J57DRAFT_1221517 [Mycena rebaudengoi]|nr:hypothetical protein C8J57DRAFT_1221517 [Mycena rebaudengoi]
MDDEAHPEPDLHHGTTDEGEPGENEYGVYFLTFSGESLNPPRSAGAIFSNTQHFVVTGGNFTSIHRPVPMFATFSRLPMGDLELRTEMYLDDHNSVVYRRERQASARRIYSARIPGVDSKMTVAVYQGNNAKENGNREFRRLYPGSNPAALSAVDRRFNSVPIETNCRQSLPPLVSLPPPVALHGTLTGPQQYMPDVQSVPHNQIRGGWKRSRPPLYLACGPLLRMAASIQGSKEIP